MRWKSHVQCGAGEKLEIISKTYLLLWLPKEETDRVHYTLKEYKNITNYEQTKETLKNIKLELPNVPDIADININRFSKKRDEKILEEIIKPKR